MNDNDKHLLIGDELTQLTDALVRLFWPAHERTPAVVSDFLAHLLGRVTVLASSAVLGVTRPLLPLIERVDVIERRQHSNSDRIAELHLRLNGRSDQIDQLLDRLLPGGEIDQMQQALMRLAVDVEALKTRAAGDG